MLTNFKGTRLYRLLSTEYFFLFLIFLVASFLRILYAFYMRADLPVDDAKGYDLLALSIWRRGEYAFQHGTPTAFRAPMYPLFLSGVYFLFGHSYHAVRIAQSMIGGLLCLVIYSIGKRLVGKSVGWISGFISALYPFFIYYTSYLLIETLFTFLLALTTYWLINATEKPHWRNLALSGIFTGLSALCKPSVFVFLPFSVLGLLIIMGIKRISTYKNTAIFLFFFIITLSPWIIRNYIIFQKIIPGTTQLGNALLDGSLLFDAQHKWRMEEEEQTNPVLVKGRELNEVERNEYYTKEALNFMRRNPVYMMKLAVLKFLKFWRLYPHIEDTYTYKHPKTLLVLLSLLSYGILLPFSVLGIILSLNKWRKFIFLYGLIVSFTGLHMIVWSQIRYRLPIMPYMIVFAAFSLSFVGEKMGLPKWIKRFRI